MKPTPPGYALRFLRWFCRANYLEEIEGDLTEVFEKQYQVSPGKAKWKFMLSVISYFRPMFMKSFTSGINTNPAAIIRHNSLITYRNFLRYKSSFFINLTGLATGLASALLIFLWVNDELSYDKFHEKDSRLYQILRNTPGPLNTVETHGSNSVLLPPALASEMPEVETVVPLRPVGPGIVTGEKESVRATGMFAGKDFFNMFTYTILKGNEGKLLSDKYAMVISADLAIKLFGSLENSLGKTVVWDMGRPGIITHVVSGIFEKPHNSSEAFDFLCTHEAFLEISRMDKTWDSNPIFVCLTLEPGVNADEFNKKLTAFYQTKRGEDADQMFLQRYSDRYLYGHFENGQPAGGRIDYVILFSLLAVFILIIACINFMNLSTARASRRLKEVGIKKAIGAMRKTLVIQYLTESMFMTILALIVAVLLVFILLPEFNLITGKRLTLTPDWRIVSGACIIVLLTGVVSGSYPALYLSGFRPSEVLKGKLNGSGAQMWVRKGLVIFQFSISILLIVAVGIVYRQLNFVQSKNLGYTKDNVITFEKLGKLNDSFESFLAEAKNIPGVISGSSSSENVTHISSTSSGHTWEGQDTETASVQFTGLNVNYDFIETLDIEMKKGRSFSRDINEEFSVILNESAVEAMGISNPVGKWLQLFGMKRDIIGVVKNFHFQSMYEPVKPIFMILSPKYTSNVIIKIQAGREREALAGLQRLYQRFNPGIPFEIIFLDDSYNALYVSEQKVAKISGYFAIVTIIISCLGLFGLAAFTAERRTKEIGIRKIMGATEGSIVGLLSADFTKMVLIAIGIALPVSYFFSRIWLQRFAYRIDPDWWLFIGAGLTAFLFAWLTVGVQTLKAASINPSECLRSE